MNERRHFERPLSVSVVKCCKLCSHAATSFWLSSQRPQPLTAADTPVVPHYSLA